MGKRIANVTIYDDDDEPLRATVKSPPVQVDPGHRPEECDMTVAHAVRHFCKLIFLVKKDIAWNYHSDMKATDRILRSCRTAISGKKSHLWLDQADYDWLTKKIEEHGAAVFNACTATVREALVEEKVEEKVAGEGTK